MTPRLHILIPVWTEGEWGQPEEVEVREVKGGRYVVLSPPRFAYGLAVGDEIELVSDQPAGFRVVKHSENLTVWVFAIDADSVPGLAAQAQERLREVNGVLEGALKSMLIVTVPLSSGWERIEAVMKDLVATVHEATWEYANVYDVEDGKTPLGWWKASKVFVPDAEYKGRR
jgi:hypothetical protein